MTVPEVRRLLTRLVWTETKLPDFILSWSWWRRCHQAQARQCHVQTPPITSATVVLNQSQGGMCMSGVLRVGVGVPRQGAGP